MILKRAVGVGPLGLRARSKTWLPQPGRRRPSELAPKRAAEEPRQPSARPNKSRRALISAAFAHLRRRGRQERKYILFHRLVLQTESRDCRCDERGPISEPNRAGLRGEARLAGRISNQA